MSNYLPGNSFNVSSVMAPAIQQTNNEQILKKEISHTLDTISAAEKQKKKPQVQVGQRPSLPPSGKSHDPNYMSIVAEAFCKAYDSEAQGTIQEVKSYAEEQQLDVTMSQSVLQSTKIAIDKEKKAIKLQAEVKKYEENVAREDKILGYVMMGIGAALILGTIIGTILSGGFLAALIPEEITAMFAESAVEVAPEIEMDTLASSSDLAETAETSDLAEESLTTDSQDTSTQESWKMWGAKRLLHMVIAGGFASPMLVEGLQGLKTSSMLNDTAKAQKQVGNALDVLQENNAYFQFYQQLLQRDSGVAQEETNNSSQIVETFGDITNAYQQISYGLASRA